MWSNLPLDLLANIFSLLSPDSLARARCACRQWRTCANTYPQSTALSLTEHRPAWFIALPLRTQRLCYAHNPILNYWHELSMDFLPYPVKLVSPIGSLLLLRFTNSPVLHLAICNPFTRQFWNLPELSIARKNPAVGVVVEYSGQHVQFPSFRVYVAGGMSEAPHGGATYESALEMYDSRDDKWRTARSISSELAVRLTVWTPNESVYCNGSLLWLTSARAYSVMGFEVDSSKCRELHVPMADRLDFAALTERRGRLALVGGTCDGDACIWELSEGDSWLLVGKMPDELRKRFLSSKQGWVNTKCVGIDGILCLYRELGCGMVVWREVRETGNWEWLWVEGCCSVRGKKVQNLPIKGTLLHPTLSHFLRSK